LYFKTSANSKSKITFLSTDDDHIICILGYRICHGVYSLLIRQQQLVQFIQHNSLRISITTRLAIPLNQAMVILTDRNPNNDAVACNGMNAFATQVNSYLIQHQISPTLAAQLMQQAQTIKATSHC
jgi:hypothetical protein